MSTVVVARAPPGGGVHRGAAGVGEQVEEASPRGIRAQSLTRDAVIEEQAGVEVVGEVDPEPEAALLDQLEVGALA